jgi:thiamine-phosphate diphosphorylase
MTPSRSRLSRPGRGILCAITDGRQTGDPAEQAALVARLAAAAAAGVDLLQVREPNLSARQLVDLVVAVVAAAAGSDALVLVNDRLDVALAAGAHGVHLKAVSMPTVLARRLLPDAMVVGRSAHGVAEAEDAARDGADYVIVGTVFETASKPGRTPGGLDLLRDAVGRCPAPVLGVGGMTVARAPLVAATGAAGMAAIQLFQRGGADAAALEQDVIALRRAFAPREK